MLENYSVLMSVYAKEQPEFFRLSIESMLTQTVKTNDFVLVCDGPLTPELDAIVAEMQQKHGDLFHVIRLETNQGLAHALNRGLRECRNELVARMDSDDIAVPNRCEMQLRKFAEHPELGIIGGAVDEFEGSPSNIVSHKSMPETHAEIQRYAKHRSPFNHPTVMYRKSAILNTGSYPDYILHEDYALWANLLLKGIRGYNLQQTLCKMRVNSGFYDRRGGFSYLKMGIRLRKHLYHMGLYSFWNYITVVSALTVSCLLPRSIRKKIYLTVLREKHDGKK